MLGGVIRSQRLRVEEDLVLSSGILVVSDQLAQVTEPRTIVSTMLHHPAFVASAGALMVTTTYGYWCLLSLQAEKDTFPEV